MQSVSVYLRASSYFIVVIHGSGGGDPCIASGPVAVLAMDTEANTLGGAILSSLGQSTNNVRWPTDWKKITEPLLASAGVTSWATFAKAASNVRVDRSGSTISVRPSRRDKASYVDLPEQTISLVAPDAASLGAAVAAALRAVSQQLPESAA